MWWINARLKKKSHSSLWSVFLCILNSAAGWIHTERFDVSLWFLPFKMSKKRSDMHQKFGNSCKSLLQSKEWKILQRVKRPTGNLSLRLLSLFVIFEAKSDKRAPEPGLLSDEHETGSSGCSPSRCESSRNVAMLREASGSVSDAPTKQKRRPSPAESEPEEDELRRRIRAFVIVKEDNLKTMPGRSIAPNGSRGWTHEETPYTAKKKIKIKNKKSLYPLFQSCRVRLCCCDDFKSTFLQSQWQICSFKDF